MPLHNKPSEAVVMGIICIILHIWIFVNRFSRLKMKQKLQLSLNSIVTKQSLCRLAMIFELCFYHLQIEYYSCCNCQMRYEYYDSMEDVKNAMWCD